VNGSHPERNESHAYWVEYLVATIPEAEPNSPTFTFGPRVNEAERKEEWRKKKKGKDAELGKRRKKKEKEIAPLKRKKKKTPRFDRAILLPIQLDRLLHSL
jgi:hypothetical protein